MEEVKLLLRKCGLLMLLLLIFVIVGVIYWGKMQEEEQKVAEEVSSTEETKNAEEEAAVQWEKGYDLPVDEQEREEAETDCKKLMKLYLDIYETADKGIASKVVLDDQTVLEIQKKVKDAGYPIATMASFTALMFSGANPKLLFCSWVKSSTCSIGEIFKEDSIQ